MPAEILPVTSRRAERIRRGQHIRDAFIAGLLIFEGADALRDAQHSIVLPIPADRRRRPGHCHTPTREAAASTGPAQSSRGCVGGDYRRDSGRGRIAEQDAGAAPSLVPHPERNRTDRHRLPCLPRHPRRYGLSPFSVLSSRLGSIPPLSFAWKLRTENRELRTEN
jgi:hypothetical protein